MKKFLYCDSCFLITFYQDGKLGSLSQYKDQFYISETQIIGELIKPDELAEIVRKSVSVITNDKDEIRAKTSEFALKYESLSTYDCLCMAYAFIDGYCLITDDKTLQKKCVMNNIEVKTSTDIVEEFLNGGNDYVNMKK